MHKRIDIWQQNISRMPALRLSSVGMVAGLWRSGPTMEHQVRFFPFHKQSSIWAKAVAFHTRRQWSRG